jgi:predicted membrane chloride channel (bestrophin family)
MPERLEIKRYAMNEKSNFAFITNLFYWQGTAVPAIIPQLVAIGIFTLTVKLIWYWAELDIPDLSRLHGLLSTFLGIVFGLRVGNATGANSDGVKNVDGILGQLGMLMITVYSWKLKDGANQGEVKALQDKMKFKMNLMWAFMRQRLRESRNGFHPKSKMVDTKFSSETYARDPSAPLIGDYLTPESTEYYGAMPVGERPIALECEMQQVASRMAVYYECPTEFVAQTHGYIDGAMGKLSACTRVIDAPIPFVYAHMLNVLLLFYIFLVPFQYVGGHFDSTGFACCIILTIGYYGINEASVALVDPYGWDPCDVDLIAKGMAVKNKGEVVSGEAAAKAVAPVSEGSLL